MAELMEDYESDGSVCSSSSDSGFSKVDFYQVQNAVPEQFRNKVDIVNKILQSEIKDIDKLRDLACSEGGLVISLIRGEAWQLFLNLSDEKKPLLDIETAKRHPEYNQVVMDVRRCLKRFPPGIDSDRIVELQEQLIKIILSVISEHEELKYYQGYHDVAVTFLIEVGQEKAYIIMEYLSLNHLRDFLMPTMDQTSYMLWHVFPLVSKLDPKLGEFITRSGIGTIFALPWLLSWFSHSLDQHIKVVRLFDYFLASPKQIILYVIAQLIYARKNEVLNVDCEMFSVHLVLSKIPEDLDFEKILVKATEMHEQYPLSKIKDEVDLLIENEAKASTAYREENEQKRLKKRKTNDRRPPFPNAFHFVPIWIPLRMRFGLLFFGFSMAAGLWAIIKSNNN